MNTDAKTVITLEMLCAKGACSEGMAWVKANLPDGAEYGAFVKALEAAGHNDWADWLISQFGAQVLAARWRIQEILDATDPKNVKAGGDLLSSGNYAKIGSSGDYAKIGSSGYSAKIGSSGNYAKIGSSGYSAQIGSSGDYAQIGSSGNSAKIGSSGDSAKIGSSGNSAKIGSSGNYAKIEASGKKSIIVAFGYKAIAKAGDDGCIALAWWDEKRPRLAVGYVGEGLKADTWYRVENGVLVEAK